MTSKVGARQADYELLKEALTTHQCSKHKNYKGMLAPLVTCIGCWEVYIHSLIDEEDGK